MGSDTRGMRHSLQSIFRLAKGNRPMLSPRPSICFSLISFYSAQHVAIFTCAARANCRGY